MRIPKDLQSLWELKLKESGFVDIEEERNGERVLKQNSANVYRQAKELERECKVEFFQVISRKINETEFPNELEEQIMQAYSEGIKQEEIRSRMANLGIKRHRITIHRIIYRHLRAWGLK